MPTWATVVRRHGVARTGRLGVGTRHLALSMGDPRFSFKRAFTIPRKIRQAVMGTAYSALGLVPGGALIQGAMQAHPAAFPNVPQIPRALAGGGGASAGMMLPAAPATGWPTYPKNAYTKQARISHGVHRRMNWANPRALGRAERRLTSFVKHFTRHARHLGMHVGRGPRGRAHLPRTRRK